MSTAQQILRRCARLEMFYEAKTGVTLIDAQKRCAGHRYIPVDVSPDFDFWQVYDMAHKRFLTVDEVDTLPDIELMQERIA